MFRKINLLVGDITEQDVDAIVNAANPTLLGGGGVDGAIHAAAGPELLKECRTLHGCLAGEAKMTRGYRLKARHVIHTVGPIWHDGDTDEEELLARCYRNSLSLAKKHGLKSIAFPSISTGAYGFPVEKAANIALKEIRAHINGDTTLDNVVIVCFNQKTFPVYAMAMIKMSEAERNYENI